jgi:hypothetical protein
MQSGLGEHPSRPFTLLTRLKSHVSMPQDSMGTSVSSRGDRSLQQLVALPTRPPQMSLDLPVLRPKL